MRIARLLSSSADAAGVPPKMQTMHKRESDITKPQYFAHYPACEISCDGHQSWGSSATVGTATKLSGSIGHSVLVGAYPGSRIFKVCFGPGARRRRSALCSLLLAQCVKAKKGGCCALFNCSRYMIPFFHEYDRIVMMSPVAHQQHFHDTESATDPHSFGAPPER